MKFAILGHMIDYENIKEIPDDWIFEKFICSPKINFDDTEGYISALKLTAKEIMNLPLEKIRNKILELAIFLQNNLSVELIQLGALTTSVTSGGKWISNQKKYRGYVNHGDSYTSAIVCHIVDKSLKILDKSKSDMTLAIVGAYGIIGEAVSKLLVPQFNNSILIGRRENKLKELENSLDGNYKTTTRLETTDADLIITSTNHPSALLNSNQIKKGAIIVDVSQPPNVSFDLCKKRKDIYRIDGGFVDIPKKYDIKLPVFPTGKIFSCMAEVIMQAMENERENHVGKIQIEHLKKTEIWADKYGFLLGNLTNYNNPIF
jgi:predicted amino acid dehydrogenase